MSKRTLEELKQAVSNAITMGDVAALKQCATELEEIGTAEAIALSENSLGMVYEITSNYSEALEHYHRALALYEELGNIRGVASANNCIGIVFVDTGNYPKALELFHRALVLHEGISDRLGIARVTGNIGLVYEQTGNYPQAMEYFNRAVALHEELGYQFGIATVTGNIGIVYEQTGNYPRSLEYFNRAVALHEELGDQLGLARVTGNIGSVYSSTNDYPQALEYDYRALALYEELGDSRGIAHVTGNIVQTLIAAASYAEAEALLASTDAIQIDVPRMMILRETARALIQEHHGKLDDAMHTLSSALEAARKHSLMSQQADIHKQMRDLCQKLNDFVGYIEHNNEFTRIQEEINGKEATTKLAVQEKQREIDAREKEHQKFMAVLHSTLPKHIADRVARGEQVTDHIDDATVMFVDIVGFTALSSTLTNQQVISLLDALFGICDEACKKNNVTRIKTIGDSYLAVAFPSTTVERDSEANIAGERDSLIETVLKDATQCSLNMANAALEILQRIKAELNDYHPGGGGIRVRIGLHVGPVTAGVLGKERLQYDIWGDTVNVASRMEGSSEPNRIHVSATFAQALQEVTAMSVRHNAVSEQTELPHGESGIGSIRVELRGETELKGKGMVKTFWLTAD